MSFISARRCSTLFQRTLDSLSLLQAFCQRDESMRNEELITAQRTLDSWYYGFGSPAVPGFLEAVASDTGGTTCDTTMHGLIREQIPDLVRISYTVPSSDIRTSAKDILLDLKTKKGFRIPHVPSISPSFMTSLQKMEHMRCLAEEPSEDEPYYTTYMLFREYWFQWGRLENYVCVMGYHPEYLECYIKLQMHLFRADLPIPYPDRHYLAVLAAAEFRCIYLVLLFARYFLAAGGDPAWLQGIQHAPIKWRQLLSLNRDLAGRPWLITADLIYGLTHRGDSNSSKETLSLSELMHAVAIMTHVHALACFIFGCGILPEIDQMEEIYHQLDPIQSNGQSDGLSAGITTNCTDGIGAHRNGLKEGSVAGDTQSRRISTVRNNDSNGADQVEQPAAQLLQIIQNEGANWEEVSEDIVAKQFMEVTKLNMELHSERSRTSPPHTGEFLCNLDQHPIIGRFLELPDSGYVDFQDRPFHVMEYSWQEEGYALADRLCSDLGSLLDEKFRNTHELTYNTLNFITNVDTSLYRRTVWNHVQSLFGICHDDFRYDRVDRLLNNSQRSYLKLCATKPAIFNPQERVFQKVFPALSTSEVVHVILMVVEARQQACLLYVLRAISECQARDH